MNEIHIAAPEAATKAAIKMLNDAAQLLEDKGWIQGDYAQDYKAYIVEPDSEEACAFCTVGAILAVSKELQTSYPLERVIAYAKLELIIGKKSIASWNDELDQTKENVIKTLRHAATL